MHLTNSICIQLTFATLVALRRDALNIMWQNNRATLDGDEQEISIGNDKHTKLWQATWSTPALFQAAHQPNQHPPCALGCPLTENQGTGENCSICEVPLTAEHPLPREGNVLQVSVRLGKTRDTAKAGCALSGRQHTAGSELCGDHLRNTTKWAGTPWLSSTKARSIIAPAVCELRRWEKPDKMLSRGAAMCPRERINSVSNVPQSDPTQFLTAIRMLASFPVSNFLSSTTLSALVHRLYCWQVCLPTSFSSTAFLFYASYKMCELSAEALPVLLNLAQVTNQQSWKGGVWGRSVSVRTTQSKIETQQRQTLKISFYRVMFDVVRGGVIWLRRELGSVLFASIAGDLDFLPRWEPSGSCTKSTK